jgi:hypothetical protein
VGKPEEMRPIEIPRRRWIILERIFKQWGITWIDTSQNRDRWWALVNIVMETLGSTK